MVKTIYTDELYHHGVKGMKWGVRKEPEYEYTGHKGSAKSHGLTAKQRKAIGVAAGAAVLTAVGVVGVKHINQANIKIGIDQVNKAFSTEVGNTKMGDPRLKAARDLAEQTTKSKFQTATNFELASSKKNPYKYQLDQKLGRYEEVSNLRKKYESQIYKMAKNDKFSTKAKNVYNYKKGKPVRNYIDGADKLNEALGKQSINTYYDKQIRLNKNAAKYENRLVNDSFKDLENGIYRKRGNR